MRYRWVQRISIIIAVLFLLAILPISALAEKGEALLTGIPTSSLKATDSNARRKAATPSNAERAADKAGETRTTGEDLAGTWAADEVTIYRFDGDGAGRLILPEHSCGFTYALEDGELVLKFESDRIGTVRFLFTLDEEALVLERTEGGFGEVVLEKTEH